MLDTFCKVWCNKGLMHHPPPSETANFSGSPPPYCTLPIPPPFLGVFLMYDIVLYVFVWNFLAERLGAAAASGVQVVTGDQQPD